MNLPKLVHRRGFSYIIAIIVVLVAATGRIELLQTLGMRAPFITFFPAVIIAALLGGLAPGLLATALSAVLATWFWMEPVGQLHAKDPADLLVMCLFVMNGAMISGITEAMHRAQTRSINAKAELQLATEREQAAATLREAQRLLVSLIEGTSDAIFLKDRQGRYLLFNSAAERITGKKAGDAIGKDDRFLFPAAEAELLMAQDRTIMVAGRVKTNEDLLTNADGEKRAFLTTKGPLFDEKGEVSGLFGIARDITERKQIEDALKRAKDEWERTFDSVTDLIAIMDNRHRIMRVNRAMAKRLGKTPKECIGQPCYSLVHGTDTPPESCPHILTLADGEEHVVEIHDDRLGGDFQVRTSPFIDERGQRIGTVHVIHDITEQKQAQESIRHLNEELEQRVQERTAQLAASNRELESFSYSVSHDLQAPLRHMAGYSSIVLEDFADKLDEEGANYLKRITRACDKMGSLIDSLLQLSRLSRADLRIQAVNLSRIAREVINELQQGNPDRNVRVAIAEGLTANGDPVLLRIVLENLLGNAWKYTRHAESAEIELGAEVNDGKTSYFVRDNGAGFDMAYADKLFGAFQRLHTEAEFEGMGIGLATVQRIIHRHGGDIRAQAEKGKGATVSFTLGG